jgi:hypothetical protein
MRKVKVEISENGKVLESAVACTWTNFLNGRWSKDRPTRPGKYIIANRAGRVTGEVFVFFDAETEELAVRIRDGALCKIKEIEEQGIWWWSIPMPLLMPIAVPRNGVDDFPNSEEMFGSPEERQNRARLRQLRDEGKITKKPGKPHLEAVKDVTGAN